MNDINEIYNNTTSSNVNPTIDTNSSTNSIDTEEILPVVPESTTISPECITDHNGYDISNGDTSTTGNSYNSVNSPTAATMDKTHIDNNFNNNDNDGNNISSSYQQEVNSEILEQQDINEHMVNIDSNDNFADEDDSFSYANDDSNNHHREADDNVATGSTIDDTNIDFDTTTDTINMNGEHHLEATLVNNTIRIISTADTTATINDNTDQYSMDVTETVVENYDDITNNGIETIQQGKDSVQNVENHVVDVSTNDDDNYLIQQHDDEDIRESTDKHSDEDEEYPDNNNLTDDHNGPDAAAVINEQHEEKMNSLQTLYNSKKQNEVIELIDDDSEDDSENDDNDSILDVSNVSRKKPKLEVKTSSNNFTSTTTTSLKNIGATINASRAAAMASFNSRQSWVNNMTSTINSIPKHQLPLVPPTIQQQQLQQPPPFKPEQLQHMQHPLIQFDVPQYVALPVGFKPTWKHLAPAPHEYSVASPTTAPLPGGISANGVGIVEKRSYRLSLLNINEFTITGLPIGWSSPPTSVSGLRTTIKKVSRGHGNAIFERDKDESGLSTSKWRIPLGAYHSFVAALTSDPNTMVEPIPQRLLQMASLEKAREEKGFPSAQELIDKKVPEGIARALAPFQCGGVDFVISKHGRALLADDMGLGKSIQAVASMAAYRSEWPLLVLCPSGARYHWEAEFKRWLGIKSVINEEYCTTKSGKEALLRDNQIHVVPNSKAPIIPSASVRVVIVSYGLAPVLVESKKLYARQFRCAIVDESHMLKNKASKRTMNLLPILQAMSRCILLSGTPALARPAELWPQLSILAVEKEGWWDSEDDFMDKYVKKGGGTKESAELHTLLRGTIMIRRLKNDILKTLPKKRREKVIVNLLNDNDELKKQFNNLLAELREGKGAMGKLARVQYGEDGGKNVHLYNFKDKSSNSFSLNYDPGSNEDEMKVKGEKQSHATAASLSPLDSIAYRENDNQLKIEYQNCVHQLDRDIRNKFRESKARIKQTIAETTHNLDSEQRQDVVDQLEGGLRNDLEQEYFRSYNEIRDTYKDFLFRVEGGSTMNTDETPINEEEKQPENRANVLNRLYSLSGDIKIPLIVDMLKLWLEDPTKGKLCIFAHHISVLDALEINGELSNVRGSRTRFIRIDGKTLPKPRQEQIELFQKDPQVRIALLGITAAGVAVNLTASSTVWFAELFWTPAIMIQAEDRCHRIGQQARVKCLYFVAKGTLDDVLWKLIEKKFQDLGEFVEGKEKLKLVVDHTYHGTKELYKMFSDEGDGEDDDDAGADDEDDKRNLKSENDDNEDDGAMDEELDSQLMARALENDITQLGQEEELMLHLNEENDENDGEDTKPSTIHSDTYSSQKTLGSSENAAIALLDDDDDDDDNNSDGNGNDNVDDDDVNDSKVKNENGTNTSSSSSLFVKKEADWVNVDTGIVHGMNVSLNDCRIYTVKIGDSRLGVDVCLFQQRLVIRKINPHRYDRLGPHSKPNVGDVLVAINGNRLSLISELVVVLQYLQRLLKNPPVLLTFMEIPSFITRYKEHLNNSTDKKDSTATKQYGESKPNGSSSSRNIGSNGYAMQQNTAAAPVEDDDDDESSVIELLDD